jgi:hypothetical protein
MDEHVLTIEFKLLPPTNADLEKLPRDFREGIQCPENSFLIVCLVFNYSAFFVSFFPFLYLFFFPFFFPFPSFFFFTISFLLLLFLSVGEGKGIGDFARMPSTCRWLQI